MRQAALLVVDTSRSVEEPESWWTLREGHCPLGVLRWNPSEASEMMRLCRRAGLLPWEVAKVHDSSEDYYRARLAEMSFVGRQ